MRLISLFLIFISSQVQAADIGLSVRALGMGNAYTAVVADGDAIFYNPAGLARMSGFRWTIMDPALGLNNIDSYQDYLDIAKDSSDITGIMNRLYGDEVTVYGGGKSLFSIGGFSFGAYGVTDSNFLVNNPVFPNIESEYRLDYGFVAGWGFDLVDDMVSIGVQSRRINRSGGNAPIGVSSIATLDSDTIQNELNRSGIGYAFDLGLNITFPSSLKPTVAFSWRDVGDTSFEPVNAGDVAPDPVRSEQIVGIGFTYDTTLMSVRPALDFRYLNRSDIQLGKKVNFGLELGFPMLDVRGGFHQGYLSYGVGFDLWIFRIDAASYGVELGEFPGQLEDRRYMAQFTIEFGVDASFSWFKISRPSTKNHSRKLRR